jgi:transcriptional regulator with XRE-family HTH domain
MPTLRHEDIRDELIAGLSAAGRRQYEGFAAIYEARQIASGLAELRTTAHLSQREAAKRAGVDQADLSRIESGQITPSLPTLLRLLDVVGGSLVLARNPAPRRQAARTTPTRASSSSASAGQTGSAKSIGTKRTAGIARESAPTRSSVSHAKAAAKRSA